MLRSVETYFRRFFVDDRRGRRGRFQQRKRFADARLLFSKRSWAFLQMFAGFSPNARGLFPKCSRAFFHKRQITVRWLFVIANINTTMFVIANEVKQSKKLHFLMDTFRGRYDAGSMMFGWRKPLHLSPDPRGRGER
jgi:hypothetical protein